MVGGGIFAWKEYQLFWFIDNKNYTDDFHIS